MSGDSEGYLVQVGFDDEVVSGRAGQVVAEDVGGAGGAWGEHRAGRHIQAGKATAVKTPLADPYGGKKVPVTGIATSIGAVTKFSQLRSRSPVMPLVVGRDWTDSVELAIIVDIPASDIQSVGAAEVGRSEGLLRLRVAEAKAANGVGRVHADRQRVAVSIQIELEC